MILNEDSFSKWVFYWKADSALHRHRGRARTRAGWLQGLA